MYVLLDCLSLHSQIPPSSTELFLWVHSMGLIKDYFSKGFGCDLFYILPQEQRWEWCQGLSFPLCCFITVQPPLLTPLWLIDDTLIIHFGRQAFSCSFRNLLCPVDSASTIRIPQHNPNHLTANFENIDVTFAEQVHSLSAFFKGRYLHIQNARQNWQALEAEDEGAGNIPVPPAPHQERHCGAAVRSCS